MKNRADEKQAARDADEEALLSGTKTAEELKKENSIFIELSPWTFNIRSIGGRPIKSRRKD